jgi:hypothetical protein
MKLESWSYDQVTGRKGIFWGRSRDRIPVGRDIPHPYRPALGSTQPPIQWVPDLISGGKPAGAWRWQPTPYSTEVKERVEPSWPVLGWTLSLLYRFHISEQRLLGLSCPSVALPVCLAYMYQLGFHWRDFRYIWYWRLFKKSVGEYQIWLTCGTNTRHLTWRSTRVCYWQWHI